MTLFFPFLPATTRLYANKISAPRHHEKYREFSRRKRESVFERKVRWALGRELKSSTRVKGRFVGNAEKKDEKRVGSFLVSRAFCSLSYSKRASTLAELISTFIYRRQNAEFLTSERTNPLVQITR